MKKNKNPYTQALIDAYAKDEKEHKAGDFDLGYIKVKHQDGSSCKFRYFKYERIEVGKRKCTLVYTEHNGVHIFVEADLESVKIKQYDGKKYKLELDAYF